MLTELHVYEIREYYYDYNYSLIMESCLRSEQTYCIGG